MDSSKRSLKPVLLHNENKYASIPVGHSTKLKEEYNNIKQKGVGKIELFKMMQEYQTRL